MPMGPAAVEVLAAQRCHALRDGYVARDRPRGRRRHGRERAGSPAMTDQPRFAKLSNPAHVEDLLKSGLTSETIVAGGFYTATRDVIAKLLGYPVATGGMV